MPGCNDQDIAGGTTYVHPCPVTSVESGDIRSGGQAFRARTSSLITGGRDPFETVCEVHHEFDHYRVRESVPLLVEREARLKLGNSTHDPRQ
jgi:hypothetical protein